MRFLAIDFGGRAGRGPSDGRSRGASHTRSPASQHSVCLVHTTRSESLTQTPRQQHQSLFPRESSCVLSNGLTLLSLFLGDEAADLRNACSGSEESERHDCQ
eukprot:2557950-Rhodomonas_salina.1